MKLGIITDIHHGYRGWKDEDVNFDAEITAATRVAAHKLQRYGVSHTLVLGDVVHEMDSYSQNIANLEKVVNILDKMDYDTTYTMGNHDNQAISSMDFSYITGDISFEEIKTDNNVRIFVVDSACGEHDNVGYVPEKMFEWLDENLTEDTYNVVASHFPLTYTEKYSQSKFFNEYPEGVFPVNKRLFEDVSGRVEMNICGHLHFEEHVEWEKEGIRTISFPPIINFLSNDATPRARVIDFNGLQPEIFEP